MSQDHLPYCCGICRLEQELSCCPSIKLLQEQLMQAINILGLLVEHASDKEIALATQTFNSEEIAVTTLNLISLEQKLHEINRRLVVSQQEKDDLGLLLEGFWC